MKMHILIISMFIVGFSCLCLAQPESHVEAFTNRTFYKPFVSEISSTINNISIGNAENKLPNGNKTQLTLSEIHLGVDVPLLYGKQNKFKWAMSAPVSFHMVWAPFEETTAPIINNDYRFGLSFTGISYLNNSYIKNISYKLTPFAHESTHLGDELTMYGSQNIDEFYRVNVSYEYYELGLTLNDPDTLKGNLLSYKVGFMGLLNHTKGYYSFAESEIGDTTFYPSHRWAEFYLELNYRKTEGFLASKTWNPSLSVEVRNRVKYEYGNPDKADRVWCFNAFFGYDYIPKKSSGVKSVGHYLRYYNGLNPHGQFRNFYYQFIGYSIIAYI